MKEVQMQDSDCLSANCTNINCVHLWFRIFFIFYNHLSLKRRTKYTVKNDVDMESIYKGKQKQTH